MSPVIRVVIVDDEPVARDLLRAMLANVETKSRIEVVAECGNAAEGVDAIRSLEPDVVFLDVEMPGGDGFSLIEEIGVDAMPITVFTTAYDHYALKAFDVVAADYLLKPFDEERLERTLRRVEARLRRGGAGTDERLAELLDRLRRHDRYPGRLAVDAGNHMTLLATDAIDWIEAKGKYCVVHAGGATYLVRDGLTNVAERLDPAEFIRIHRSSVVRIDRIRQIHRWFRGDYHIVLEDGTKLTSGGTYRKDIEAVVLGNLRPPR